MDKSKILEVIEIYRDEFESKGIGKIDYPHNVTPQNVSLAWLTVTVCSTR